MLDKARFLLIALLVEVDIFISFHTIKSLQEVTYKPNYMALQDVLLNQWKVVQDHAVGD